MGDASKKQVSEIFRDKQNTDINVVWDASKAHMRGLGIQQMARLKKIKDNNIQELTNQIRINEKELIKNPKSHEILQKIKILQSHISRILNKEVENKIKWGKQRYFESANKPGKLLAWMIKEKQTKKVINKILDQGEEITDPVKIKIKFLNFYKDLYKQEHLEVNKMEEYLQQNKLPRIEKEEVEALNSNIEIDEMAQVIKKNEEWQIARS